MNPSTLRHFGLEETGFYRGGPFQDYTAYIKGCIRSRDMLAITGDVGSGKTTLFNSAVREMEQYPDRTPRFIYVRNFFKEHLNIAGILSAIIMDISQENIRRDLEARSRQVIRLLGAMHVSRKRDVCIIIEEAHRVHANTLRALKELREASFAGVSPLFSVILIGHPQLTAKLRERKEVFWRSEILELTENNGWMNYDERIRYLRAVYGEAINNTARQRIAILKKTPLSMDFFVAGKMKEARLAGLSRLDETCVDAGLAEMKESLDVSLGDIAREAGMGKTTVHEVLRGVNQRPEKKDAVKRALERLAESRKNKTIARAG